MRRKTKQTFLFIFGAILLVLGIIGVFLPFLQGFLFIIFGVYLLALSSEKTRAYLARVADRFPRLKPLWKRAGIYKKEESERDSLDNSV